MGLCNSGECRRIAAASENLFDHRGPFLTVLLAAA